MLELLEPDTIRIIYRYLRPAERRLLCYEIARRFRRAQLISSLRNGNEGAP